MTLEKPWKNRRVWTTEEDALVQANLDGHGMTYSELGERFGVSRTTIARRANVLRGLEPRYKNDKITYWTPEEDAILMDAHRSGISYLEVLQKLPGRTRSSVAGRYARLRVRAMPFEERVKARKESEERWPRRTQKKNAGGRPRTRPAVLSTQTPMKKRPPVVNFVKRSTAKSSLLPHVTTKQGTLLHVYPKDPYALMPLATFEKIGSRWVMRGDETRRFPTTTEAVRAMEPAW